MRRGVPVLHPSIRILARSIICRPAKGATIPGRSKMSKQPSLASFLFSPVTTNPPKRQRTDEGAVPGEGSPPFTPAASAADGGGGGIPSESRRHLQSERAVQDSADLERAVQDAIGRGTLVVTGKPDDGFDQPLQPDDGTEGATGDDNYCRGKSTPAQEKAYIAMVQVRTQRPTANDVSHFSRLRLARIFM
eukprot:COSAG02_NODE_846_length_16565_cov_20.404627_11_plen_191_part_00